MAGDCRLDDQTVEDMTFRGDCQRRQLELTAIHNSYATALTTQPETVSDCVIGRGDIVSYDRWQFGMHPSFSDKQECRDGDVK